MRVHGVSDHQIDDKGRLNIPRKMQVLFEQGGFLTRAFNGLSLVFYPNDVWVEVQNRLASFEFTETAADDVSRYLSYGTDIRLDGQGRLSIPPTLRRLAKIDKDVTLIAMGDKIEVWDTTTLQSYDEQLMAAGTITQALKAINPRPTAA